MSLVKEIYPAVEGKCPKSGCKGKLVMDTLVGSVTCLECGGRWRGSKIEASIEAKEVKETKKK